MPSKRFVVRKFVGTEYAVIDQHENATIGVHPTKQAAVVVANLLNLAHLANARAADRMKQQKGDGR